MASSCPLMLGQVDTAILSFSKAFDMVSHKKFLHKLDHYGVRGALHIWLTTFLTQRSMKVVTLESESSDEVPVESGVPQGTVLGLILFLYHVNDLPSCVTSQVRLFADDCLVYRESNKFRDHITWPSKMTWSSLKPGPKNGWWNSMQRNVSLWALGTKLSFSIASTMKF